MSYRGAIRSKSDEPSTTQSVDRSVMYAEQYVIQEVCNLTMCEINIIHIYMTSLLCKNLDKNEYKI
jgi:hypothetical protein